MGHLSVTVVQGARPWLMPGRVGCSHIAVRFWAFCVRCRHVARDQRRAGRGSGEKVPSSGRCKVFQKSAFRGMLGERSESLHGVCYSSRYILPHDL